MCEPGNIHVDAAAERASLLGKLSNAAQVVALKTTWARALLACRTRTVPAALVKGNSYANGRIYAASVVVRPFLGLGSTITAVTAAGHSNKAPNYCMDVLACDIQGSPWLLKKGDPQVRAGGRLP